MIMPLKRILTAWQKNVFHSFFQTALPAKRAKELQPSQESKANLPFQEFPLLPPLRFH